MHQSKLKKITLGVLLAFLPYVANAAGLGKLNVMSGLGEPLSAEIEILATTPEELAELTAAIAPEEAYSMQGLERPGFHNMIKVEVRKKANGTPVIKLSTNQPVTDPFLDMLVQVDWPTGRLVREFTLLLDPPDYTNSSIASPSSPASKAQQASRAGNNNSATDNSSSVNPPQTGASSGKSSRNSRNNSKRAPAPADNTPATATANAVESSSLTTVRGDSLVKIARQNQVEGVNLDQMLIGIFRANQGAFVNDNINRLKVGQIVRIPSAEEVQSISAGEASRQVRAQSADWQAYRNRLAGAVAEAPATREEGSSDQQASGGKVTASAQDKSIPEATGPRDVVKLSKNDTNASQATAENKGLQDKLSALQEEAVAREKSIKEANDRAALLEKQIKDMQTLLAMKSQAMSDIQKNAAAAEPVKLESATPEAPVNPAPAAAAETAPVASTPQPQTPVAATPSTPPASEKSKPVPAVPAAAPAVLPTDESNSLLDELTENPLLLGAAGLLIVLLGAWLLVRNRRKRGLDGFEKSILTSGGLKANTVFGNTLGGTVNTGDTSFLTDFSQSSSGMIDTNDVDPIAEAEVYMAYGRDKQAEEILREAISKDPARHELQIKLLEIYVGRNDSAAFETTAGELYTTLGAHDPVWTKVAELGRQVEPENPLYQVVPVAAHDPFANDAGKSAVDKLGASDLSDEADTQKSDLDFVMDAGAVEDLSQHTRPGSDLLQANEVDFSESFNTSSADESALDFDLGSDDTLASDRNEDTQDAGPTEEIVMGGESDFDLPDAEVSDVASSDNTEETSTSELDFQLDAPSADDNSNDLDFDLGDITDTNTANDSAFKAGDSLDVDLSDQHVANAQDSESTLELDLSQFGNPDTSADKELPADSTKLAALQDSAFDALPDLNFGEVPSTSEPDDFSTNNPAQDIGGLPEFEPSFESSVPEISFDLPENQVDEKQPKPADAELELPDFEKTMVMTPEDMGENIIMESTPEQDQALDLDFDVDLDAAEEESALPASAPTQANPQEIDLSGISFDLDDKPEADSAPDASATDSLAAESSEVDTKLDLVTAYVDMGDNEGARELLEEILQEGGPNQRLRAQDMLKSLD